MSYDSIHGDIIYAKAIDTRIAELREITVRYARDMEWDESEELGDLLNFRQAVQGEYGAAKWADGMSFLADEYRDEYASDTARELYGEATELSCWHDDEWCDLFYEGWKSFRLEETDYWTNGKG